MTRSFILPRMTRGRRLVRHWFENQPARGSAPGAFRQQDRIC